jgi:hypothetical protein
MAVCFEKATTGSSLEFIGHSLQIFFGNFSSSSFFYWLNRQENRGCVGANGHGE